MKTALNFAEFIDRERERLRGERDALLEQRQGLDNELAQLDNELAAISAYENAKTAPGRPTASTPGRRRRGGRSKREQLLTLIQSTPGGLARKDLLERMGLKGDKSGEMSVSNALTALVKQQQVERHDGRYIAGA